MADSNFPHLMWYNIGSTANLCFPTGAAQVPCFDAAGCGGTETAVNTTRECCLGSGLSFRNDSGVCRQCIGKLLIIFLSNLSENSASCVKCY